MGEGSLRCSLYLFQGGAPHTDTNRWPHSFCLKDPYPQVDQYILDDSFALEMGLDTILPAYPFDTLS